MAQYLGIDAGGSATRWSLVRSDGSREASGAVNGFSGHLFRPQMQAQAKAAIEAIFTLSGPVDAIVAGVTGLSRHAPEARLVQDWLASAFGASRIAVTSDIELACRALFPPGEGIVVYAGTGSIAAHLTEDGTLLTAGGKGVLIDDAGGGYWIAVTALRRILRAEDSKAGSGWSSRLGQEMAQALGGPDWPTVRQAFYGLDRGDIGMLALPVAAAAAVNDPVALAVLAEAGRELALLATMLEGRVGKKRIGLAGRASTLHPVVLASMREALPHSALALANSDFATAAAVLAARGSIFAGLSSA